MKKAKQVKKQKSIFTKDETKLNNHQLSLIYGGCCGDPTPPPPPPPDNLLAATSASGG